MLTYITFSIVSCFYNFLSVLLNFPVKPLSCSCYIKIKIGYCVLIWSYYVKYMILCISKSLVITMTTTSNILSNRRFIITFYDLHASLTSQEISLVDVQQLSSTSGYPYKGWYSTFCHEWIMQNLFERPNGHSGEDEAWVWRTNPNTACPPPAPPLPPTTVNT